jgi:hypothetical protein
MDVLSSKKMIDSIAAIASLNRENSKMAPQVNNQRIASKTQMKTVNA